jgi:hypothetical protein
MSSRAARRAFLPVALLAGLFVPASASAWTVTVHVHGAGRVDETTDRNLMFCTTPSDVANGTVTDCVAGTQNGLYSSFDVINLQAQVPQAYFDRGWRFQKWVDSKDGGGQINCDPQDTGGDHTSVNCQFQIFENLQTNLYFVDTFGPDQTDITSGPGSATNSTAATFNFNAADDPDARFDCRLDPPGASTGTFVACGSSSDQSETYTGLADGDYTLYVRGRDAQGNVDGTPDSWSWSVDTVAPTVTIGGGPTGTTESTSATFSVSSTEGAPVCTLDGASTACNTTKSNLADGSHTFAASATDAANNTGTASRTWTVAAPPETTITGGPAEQGVSGASTTFTFTASEAGSTFRCTLDGVTSDCTSPLDLTGLSPGPHTFGVVARDPAGNTDASPATRTWTVDTTPPETQLLTGPGEGSTSPDRSVTFTFASPESASTFECRIDDAPFAVCSSPATFDDIPIGDHTFEVRAKDAAGNVDPTPEARSWRVNTLDADGDGINRPADCNDGNPAIHPGATDVPDDGVDQDCDGVDSTNLDRDGDGINRPQDCNDSDPSVRPGATETPADGIDQNCDGKDAPRPEAPAAVSYKWGPPGARTKVIKLMLTKLTPGAKVTVNCRGKRCPIKKKTAKAARTGKVDVRKLLKRKPVAAGSKVTITISVPEHVSKVLVFAFRRGKSPKGGSFRCLPPGAEKTVACG